MRKLKKLAAVALAASMSMAMCVSAFAQDVTFHFKDAKGWGPSVYGWIYEGTAWTTNVSNTNGNVCPALNPNKVGDDGTTSVKPLWPGAKCTDEGNGWFKITVTFSDDVANQGAVMKFNNGVCDAATSNTQQEDDLAYVQSSGLPTTATAEKLETPSIMFMKSDLTANEYWIDWTGESTNMTYAVTKPSKNTGEITTTAPASYTTGGSNNGGSSDTGSGDNNTTVSDNTGSTGDNTSTDGTGSATGTTSTKTSNKKAPTTGDSVAMTVVLFGIASAVAFVVVKRKVNA